MTALDDSGRRARRQVPGQVPAIGDLLRMLERARLDSADTADVEYADDGRPLRITLDWDKDAIDDEALYVISAYEPADN
ncbi:DUF6174 domain-containing protein [Streptomyces phyllanthi]|uniref:Uncharacterized protein n=1 Tax=Streptomyces phyllanthi TaxID=1803180 RepID=A0A5N8W2E7_9ACTN|nr:DUF6174 domain-containing protein [Streptomyces phyllanthi]MPY41449.1 hypothetical protein [Streptomyces phyllanthi]